MAPAATAPAADSRAGSAVTTEAGTCRRGPVRAAVMHGDHLDVHVVPASVGLLVLDARIRKMDLLVEVRQVVLAGPFLDLVRVAIGVAVVVVAVAIVLMEPLLVVALELVVQNDPIDPRAALFQALRFAFESPVDLHVVLKLPLAFDARVEGLAALPVAVTVALEQAAALLRQRYSVVARARDPRRLD